MAIRVKYRDYRPRGLTDAGVLDWFTGCTDTFSGCVEWRGPIGPQGYGYCHIRDENVSAHVLAWQVQRGPIPKGMSLDHECHNTASRLGLCAGGDSCPHRRCINVEHFTLKPIGENILASATTIAGAFALRTKCGSGHPFSPENTILRTDTGRRCRICKTAQYQKGRQVIV